MQAFTICPRINVILNKAHSSYQFNHIQSDLCLALSSLSRVALIFSKVDADTVHAMSFVRGRCVSFSFEHMAQVSSTVAAYNLCPFHAESAIRMPGHCSWDCIEEGGPSAARLELVVGLVERSGAAGAAVDAGSWGVLIVFAGKWCFSALLAKDAELFYTGEILARHLDECYEACYIYLWKAVLATLQWACLPDKSCFWFRLWRRSSR